VTVTRIEWTERTWNPTTGCDQVSPGCDHCYALTMSARLKAMGSKDYQMDGDPRTSGPGFGLALHEDRLGQPFTWKKPAVVFVNSMSDLFHDRVPLAFLRDVFEVMERTPRHTYQILTKRSTRLLRVAPQLPWPPNVWMGVSVEDQARAYRATRLLMVPAAVRFLSVEPLLGPVDLTSVQAKDILPVLVNVLRGSDAHRINWVIAGGESGPGARPCETDWLRSLRDQCQAEGVPYFLKQVGSRLARELGCSDKKGGKWDAWPADLRVREMPR
jgi:protein gp37